MDHITNEQYTKNVVARASNEFHDNIHMFVLAETLLEFSNVSRRLDIMKKAMFYGKLDEHNQDEMDMMFTLRPRPEGCEDAERYFGTYENDPNTPIVLNDTQLQMFHSIIGICTEAGELVESFINNLADVQKGAKPVGELLDRVNLREELGDVQWYTALGCNAIGSSLAECMTINDNKLEARYGPAFSAEKANERDLDNERTILEG